MKAVSNILLSCAEIARHCDECHARGMTYLQIWASVKLMEELRHPPPAAIDRPGLRARLPNWAMTNTVSNVLSTHDEITHYCDECHARGMTGLQIWGVGQIDGRTQASTIGRY